jgi:hypothetical protein
MFYVKQDLCYVLQLFMGFEPIIGKEIGSNFLLAISWKKQLVILGENVVRCMIYHEKDLVFNEKKNLYISMPINIYESKSVKYFII